MLALRMKPRFNAQEARRSNCIAASVIVILFLSGIGLLGYFFSDPINEMSSYTVTSATVDPFNFSVDPFNFSSSQLTATWNISINIENYYRSKDIYFDRVKSSIYYGYHLLAQVSMHHFYVLRRGGKTLKACLMNHSESLDVDAAKSMVRERLLHGAVDFRVELLARANGYNYNISCENVTVGFPATHDVGPGVMLGPRRKCNVLVDGKTNNKGWG